jgi:hypothetical protein
VWRRTSTFDARGLFHDANAVLRFAAVLALVALAADASAQSLGDAAAKERRRREGLQRKAAPARVVTEDELATTSGRIANDPTATPANAPAADPSSSSAASVEAVRTADEHREVHWRLEARRRRERLDAAEDTLKRTARWSDPTYAGNDRPSCPITRRNQQASARTELANARQSLEALENEARVAGALPGWIR